jgi:hypothetical protein
MSAHHCRIQGSVGCTISSSRMSAMFMFMVGDGNEDINSSKRRRLAARLQAEVGDYYAAYGDLALAIPMFKRVLKRYRIDQWDRSHFWRLFCLAYCQRTLSKPTSTLPNSCQYIQIDVGSVGCTTVHTIYTVNYRESIVC